MNTADYEKGMTDGYRHFHKRPALTVRQLDEASKNKDWRKGFDYAIRLERWKAWE